MTAVAASSYNGWSQEGSSTQLPPGSVLPLQASAQAGQGQYIAYDASGNVALVDGAVPGLISAGVADPGKLSATSTTAGAANIMAWWGFGGHNPASTTSNDTPTAASVCTPVWGASANAVGLLSNSGGNNRTLVGLCFGLYDDGTPRVWSGPVAQAVARAVMIANAWPHAWYTITDAAANTATTERAIPRSKVHGTVTRIEFVGAAVAADASDYATITISARDGAGGSARTLGTYSTATGSNGAITAFVPAVFTLGTAADLYLLETDIVTITVTKANSGKQLIGEILVNGKAI